MTDETRTIVLVAALGELLAILDAIGGYMHPEQQDALARARMVRAAVLHDLGKEPKP